MPDPRARPLVGITQCLDDRGRWRAGRDYHYLDAGYAAAIERAGGTPVYLPIQDDPAVLAARIDALCIPGGDDFLPADAERYASVRFDPAPAEQVAFDRRLLDAVLGRQRPVLGICYGMQLLALHHGGALHHHLPLDAPKAEPHKLPEPDGRHPLVVETGSRLADLVLPAAVNSLHHQAVADPGTGLRASARAPDGVVEAIEASGAGFCLGVQWHPEKLPAAEGAGVFQALVAACAAGC